MCHILYKGDGLRFTVYSCYLWEVVLNVLDVSFVLKHWRQATEDSNLRVKLWQDICCIIERQAR
jgi:hypothetical protein